MNGTVGVVAAEVSPLTIIYDDMPYVYSLDENKGEVELAYVYSLRIKFCRVARFHALSPLYRWLINSCSREIGFILLRTRAKRTAVIIGDDTAYPPRSCERLDANRRITLLQVWKSSFPETLAKDDEMA